MKIKKTFNVTFDKEDFLALERVTNIAEELIKEMSPSDTVFGFYRTDYENLAEFFSDMTYHPGYTVMRKEAGL